MIPFMKARTITRSLLAVMLSTVAWWWIRSRPSPEPDAPEIQAPTDDHKEESPEAPHITIPPEWMLSSTGRSAAARITTAYDLARLPEKTSAPEREDITRAIFLVREAGIKAQAGAVDEAIGLYEQALDIFPRMNYANKELGRLQLIQGRIPEAIKHLSTAVETDDYPEEALNELGIAHLYAGRYDPALAAFQGSAELDPERAEARFNMGVALRKSGRLKEARELFVQERERAPANPRIHREIALIDHAEGRMDIALASLERAMDLDPAWYPPYLDAALIYAGERDWARALEALHQALNTAPPLVVFQVYSQPAFRDIRPTGEAKKLEARITEILRNETAKP